MKSPFELAMAAALIAVRRTVRVLRLRGALGLAQANAFQHLSVVARAAEEVAYPILKELDKCARDGSSQNGPPTNGSAAAASKSPSRGTRLSTSS